MKYGNKRIPVPYSIVSEKTHGLNRGRKASVGRGEGISFTSPTFEKRNFTNKHSHGNICIVGVDENQVVAANKKSTNVNRGAHGVSLVMK